MSNVSKALLYFYDSTTKQYKPISDMENINVAKFIPKVEMYWYDKDNNAYKPLIIDGKMPVNEDVIAGVSSHLDDKMNTKRDIYKKITLDDLEASVLSAMTGGATVNVNSTPSDGSVTPSKTTFFVVSKNAFNNATGIQANKTFDSTGTIIEDTTRWVSDFFIPVTQGMKLVFNTTAQVRIMLYTSTYTVIGSRTGTTADATLENYQSYTVSSSVAKFIKISAMNTSPASTLMVSNDGVLRKTYEKYGVAVIPNSYMPTEVKDKLVEVEGKLSNLPEGTVTPPKTNFFDTSKNAFNKDAPIQTGKSFDSTGVIVDDSIRWLSEFYIPVSLGMKLVFNSKFGFRIVSYDTNKNFLTRLSTTADTTLDNYHSITVTNTSTRFVRISSTTVENPPQNIMLSTDGVLRTVVEPYGKYSVKKSYIPDLSLEDLPTLASQVGTGSIDEDAIISLIQANSGTPKAPYPPRFELSQSTIVRHDSSRPMWLSEDGKILYGHQGSRVMMSTDEWTTLTRIGTTDMPQTVTAIRPLPDGQLLVSTNRNDDLGIRAKLYRSNGFDPLNPSVTTWTEVLSATGQFANIQNNWGIHIYDDVILISEYGLKGETGARYCYISRDNGNTFTTIFDQKNQVIAGRPEYTATGHIHTIQFDPYYHRIWLCVGDNPNTAVYYSDDYGVNWTFVTGTTVVQFTGIIALEDCVVFGSDRDPNGLYIYRRKDKATMPKIEPWFLVDSSNIITHIFNLPYRRTIGKDIPVYFPATTATTNINGGGATTLMAFIDGRVPYIMWQPTPIYSTTNGGQGIQWALGDTVQGNVIVVIQEPSPATGFKVLKWKAPVWQ